MYTEDPEVAEEIDDAPNWVKEGTVEDDTVIEGEDIHAAEQMERSDVIEPAKGVEVFIKSIKVDKYTPEGQAEWKLINIEPMIVIGEKGVDGKGKYKNKHFFPRILVAVNRKAYDFSKNAAGKETQYYSPSGGAFGDYNAFLTALGFPTNPAPRNDAAFRQALVGRRMIVDIVKDRRQVKDNVTGKYVYVDEYENKLLYKGAPKAAPKPDVAEAAAS
jgi:hypothetical protein